MIVILEGLVTTRTSDGRMHIAPMGPYVHPETQRLTLKPFQTSQTYRNLRAHGEGVFHLTDDVRMLAYAALGKLSELPEHFPATQISGFVIANCCRYLEFVVQSIDDAQERVIIETETVFEGRLRDSIGFNRAKHLVLEAAILATRFHLLDLRQIAHDYDRMMVVIEKTGGPDEISAMQFLRAELDARLKLIQSPAISGIVS